MLISFSITQVLLKYNFLGTSMNAIVFVYIKELNQGNFFADLNATKLDLSNIYSIPYANP